MTATRLAKIATIAAAVALWTVAAWLLWRTAVPGDLRLPRLDPARVFGPRLLRRADAYQRFYDVEWIVATLARVGVLVLLARRLPPLAPRLGLGRVNAGIVLGVVSVVAVAAAGLPFHVADEWWARRHGISRLGVDEWLLGPWGGMLGTVVVATIALATVLGLAGVLGRRWWVAAVPAFAALAVVILLVVPYLASFGASPLRPGRLDATVHRLARAERTAPPAVFVYPAHERTRTANAFAVGVGPGERIILWDTLLRFRFPEVRFVVAHELAHVARSHVWKGLGWFLLLLTPAAAVVAAVTEPRGGLRNPATVPLALLAAALLQLALLPVQSAISRRYETEADWTALRATDDVDAARRLFVGFARTSLGRPEPPEWKQLLLGDHPSLLDRVELAEAAIRR